MDSLNWSTMQELLEYRQRLLGRYRAVVDDFRQALAPIRPADLHAPRTEQGWSLHQILAHLRDTEAQAYLPRIQRILDEDQPFLDLFKQKQWAEAHYHPDEPGQAILAEYGRLRSQELALLEKMPEDGWSRTGRHPVLGVRTLQWWVERSLAHAEEHLQQFQGLPDEQEFP